MPPERAAKVMGVLFGVPVSAGWADKAALKATGFHPGHTGRGHLRARALARGIDGSRAGELLATASPRRHLLTRRHLKTGDLAFHYCYVPEGQT